MIAMNSLAVLLLATGIEARTLTFESKSADFSKYGGLYQSTYDKSNDRLFLTNSVGRPPVTQADLIEVDPKSLTVVKDVQPATVTVGNLTQRYAVYGVDYDEKNDRVWVTNTRQSTVAYYNGKDLSLGNQYPTGLQPGTRDVYVDQNTGLAYVSGSKFDVIDVFDASKTDSYTKSINLTDAMGKSFPGVMSLVADEVNNVLYTVSLKKPLAAAINLKDHSVKTFDLGPNVNSSLGVAWDTRREQLFVANRVSNNTVVLNPKTGKVVKSINLPGGPINARYDPLFDVVYVACRTGHSVAVIDPENYSIITHLNVTTPNHIEIAPNGDVYVTDKSPNSLLYKFTPKNATSGKPSGAGASGSSKGTKPGVANAASAFQVPVALGAIAAAALLI